MDSVVLLFDYGKGEHTMGLLNKTEAGMDYCISCGNASVHGRCSKCGREAKHMVAFNGFAFRQVPADVADALGQQKKKLFESNAKLEVQEMIRHGDLYMADILFDSILCDGREVGEREWYESEGDTENTYYVQFSTPTGEPCMKCCEVTSGDYGAVERNMRKGIREGILLKGTKKNKEYYYAYMPEDENLGKMLRLGLAKALMENGRDYSYRRLPQEGGATHPSFELTWEEAANGEGNSNW